MGLSSSKSSTTSGPSTFAQPYIGAGATEITKAYNENKGATADIASNIQSLIPGLMEKYQAGNPSVNAASGYNSDVLGGKYLGSNPYLEDILKKTSGSVLDKVGGAFGSRGSFGGTKYAEAAGRGVADSENALRYNDYSTERGRMDTAAGQAPSLAAADYLGITPLLATAQAGTELPFSAVNEYGSLIAQLLGNSTTTTQKNSPSTLDSIGKGLSTAASAATLFSDRRLKVSVERVDSFEDGLGLYEYNYTWGGDRQRGVMADEVALLRPWALGPVIEGYATVNYGAL